jgi:hypothetical protein
MASESNPGPRLALEPGTRRVLAGVKESFYDTEYRNRMNLPRYMCSHLVSFRSGARECVMNLEEIWETGALLESDEPVQAGIRAEMRSETAFFAGDIVEVEEHEFGWRLRMEFSPMTPWRPEVFRPGHLVEIGSDGATGSP